MFTVQNSFIMTTLNLLLLMIILALAVHPIECQYASTCLTADTQQIGRCMPIKSCKSVYRTFETIKQRGGNISDNEKANLSRLYCGTYKNVVHVCCLETDIQLNVEGLNILNNTTCGAYGGNRIAHGQPAALFEYPWMALLKYNSTKNQFKCGGTLISHQYVLTAAHCIKGLETTLKEVRLGEYQISTVVDCTNATRKNECAPPVEDIEIEDIIIHENYNAKAIYNDIALIRLASPVEFKRHIKAICLPIFDDLRSKEYDNYIITGWGKTENGIASDILLAAYLPITERSVCEYQLRSYNLRQPLNTGHICAGGRNLIDACRGDSGGPLGYRDFYKGRPRFIQLGIVSLGLLDCGIVNVAGVYTNVSYHIQWITDNIKENTGTFTRRFLQEAK